MEINYDIKWYTSLPNEAKTIRQEVFVEEQGFTEEFDTIDQKSYHLVIYTKQGEPVATARIFIEPDGYHISRVAVRKEMRQHHIGRYLMDTAEQKIKSLKGSLAILSAQCQAQGFYETLGYKTKGDTYLDENCLHIQMVKSLVEE